MAYQYNFQNTGGSAANLPYSNGQNFQDLFNQIVGASPFWSGQNTTKKLSGQADQFSSMFKNLLGRDPTGDEINSMFGSVGNQVLQSPLGEYGTGYSDFQNLVNPYIQNTYGSDIQKNQKQQQQTQLDSGEKSIQDLINKTMENTASQFSDPNSKLYQNFSGQMNNLGISPSSSAFQAGAGSTIANSGMDAANQGLASFGIPQISGMANTANAPYQMSLQNMYPGLSSYGGANRDQYDFDQQMQLGQHLFDQSQPNGFEKGLGYANTGSNIISNLMPGAKSTSYVCMELIKRDLICESDMDDFHVHIMPAMFKKGRAFWKYAMDGKRLVDAANIVKVDWKEFKTLLFDRVMEEKDPCKAVDLYADACEQLCMKSDYSLWDHRVYRTSFVDSLIFLPRLLSYKPFVQALMKCLRVKALFLYDKPRCGVHYGA